MREKISINKLEAAIRLEISKAGCDNNYFRYGWYKFLWHSFEKVDNKDEYTLKEALQVARDMHVYLPKELRFNCYSWGFLKETEELIEELFI